MAANERIQNIIDKIPKDAPIDDISDRIQLWCKLDKAWQNIENGQTFSQDEAWEQMQSWSK